MSEEVAIQVNFGKPMPVFPLGVVALMPQQVAPFHIFETRYRQMIGDALDGSGQIAMATYDTSDLEVFDHSGDSLPLRPAVCIGQVFQHEKLPDGHYNILLQGICRAKIVDEMAPDDERAYRTAYLEPLDLPGHPQLGLDTARQKLTEHLTAWPLQQLRTAAWVVERLENEQIPDSAAFELVCFSLFTDPELRYQLLAEPDAKRRVRLVELALSDMARIIRNAASQHPERWPKGVSWN
ncbi:MAG: LON peptidase substrate-binding domain-containing protein [Phycisphaera sp.]|nr:MAG: LON peptidase substrate-binding domain-containing protein [Phycisphaera sp.]